MFLNSHITWEKLKIEFDLFKSSPPASLMPILYGVDAYLFNNPELESSLNSLKKMSFELTRRTEHLDCENKISVLNEYFFKEISFQLKPISECSSELDCWLPIKGLKNKEATPLLVSLFYQHFAIEIDVPLQMVNHPHFFVLKWIRPGKKSLFIDLSRDGEFLNNNHIAETLNQNKSSNNIFDYMDSTKTLGNYLVGLYKNIDQLNDQNDKLTLLKIMILYFPENPLYFLKRALVYKESEQFQNANNDFKKYFSLVNENSIDSEVKSMYFETQSQVQFEKSKPTNHIDLTLLKTN